MNRLYRRMIYDFPAERLGLVLISTPLTTRALRFGQRLVTRMVAALRVPYRWGGPFMRRFGARFVSPATRRTLAKQGRSELVATLEAGAQDSHWVIATIRALAEYGDIVDPPLEANDRVVAVDLPPQLDKVTRVCVSQQAIERAYPGVMFRQLQHATEHGVPTADAAAYQQLMDWVYRYFQQVFARR